MLGNTFGWKSAKLHVLVLLLAFTSGLFLEKSAQANSDPDTLRILTLNIFAGTSEMDFARLQKQIEAVQSLSPDIIALQEVFDDRAKERYKNSFPSFEAVESGKREGPPTSLQKLAGFLSRAVERVNQKVAIVPWFEGTKRILDGDTHGLLILFNPAKGKVLHESKHVEMFNHQTSIGIGPRLLEKVKPRGFLMAHYEVAGVPLLIVNTHMSNGVRNFRRRVQLKQIIERIAEKVSVFEGKHCPAIFCGDTNADGIEPEMKWLHEEQNFLDTFLKKNPDIFEAPHKGVTWHSKNPLTKGHLLEPDQRIDYISIRDGGEGSFEILDSSVVLTDYPYSDHYGVMTTVKVIPRCENLLIRNPRDTL